MLPLAVSRRILQVLLATLAIVLPAQVLAQSLTVGIKDVPFTIDPHFNTSPGPNQITRQIFDSLVRVDAEMKLQPMLAKSWERMNDTTWVFHLRDDVKFHDGTPFTAEDVVFTYGRAPNVPNATNRFTSYLSSIKTVEAVDRNTVRITTNRPSPSLGENINYVGIVSKKNGENASTDDYHSGKAMIGTGPYKFKSWVLNDNVQLTRNASYWGEKPVWENVTYRVMPNDPTRVAALLSGNVDVIDQVPSQDLKRLRETPTVSLFTKPSIRLIFYALNVTDEALDSGTITGPNGEKLTENPFKNAKVREAMKLGVDQNLILQRLYEGAGNTTAQVTPQGAIGTNAALKVPAANLQKAQELLKESGWAGKFRVTLKVPNQFFLNSNEVGQAIAQFWTRVGVPTTVETPAFPTFLKDAQAGKIGAYVIAILNVTGASDFLYRTALHTRDAEKGLGTFNFGRYQNAEMDALADGAERIMDPTAWGKAYEQAAVLVAKDATVVPLYFMGETVAARKGLKVQQRFDGMVFANAVRP